jgi:uncharacterized protein
MTTRPDQLVAEVLAAGDGEIVGRIRLQKMVYLLDQAGARSGLTFHYHYYGPYSRDLDDAIDRAQAIRGVEEKISYRQVDGMPYSIFSLRSEGEVAASHTVGHLPMDRARPLVRAMKIRSSTVLELAATIHWLVNRENSSDWRRELVRRKGVKTERGRADEALSLLKELGLAPS